MLLAGGDNSPMPLLQAVHYRNNFNVLSKITLADIFVLEMYQWMLLKQSRHLWKKHILDGGQGLPFCSGGTPSPHTRGDLSRSGQNDLLCPSFSFVVSFAFTSEFLELSDVRITSSDATLRHSKRTLSKKSHYTLLALLQQLLWRKAQNSKVRLEKECERSTTGVKQVY